MWNNLVELSQGFAGGVVVGLVTPYIVKNFGGQIWTDIKLIWSKMFSKSAPVVTPVVTPVVAPVTPVISG